MHGFRTEILLALPIMAVLALPGLARPAVVKCVDAQGKITYTDQACATDTTQQQTNAPPTRKPDSTTTAAASNSGAASASDSPSAARQGFDAAIEARVREMQTECKQGKQKACGQVECAPALKPEARPSDFQHCASVQGFKSTSAWAQMSEFRQRNHDQEDTVSVTCLQNPEVLEVGNNRSLVYKMVKVTRYAFQDGYSAYGLGGAKFNTWEQAADAACAK